MWARRALLALGDAVIVCYLKDQTWEAELNFNSNKNGTKATRKKKKNELRPVQFSVVWLVALLGIQAQTP